MMKAYVINQFGDSTVFQPVDIAKPEVQPGHLLIRVAATSVNPVDYKIRSGAVADIASEFPAVSTYSYRKNQNSLSLGGFAIALQTRNRPESTEH